MTPPAEIESLVDLETLTQELTRKWGEDAAQHALLRVIEKGWHLDPGENEVEHFARVVAKNFALDQRSERIRHHLSDSSTEELGERQSPALAQAPTQERRAQARQTLTRLFRENPTAAVRAMAADHREAARLLGVKVGTVKSRLHRRRG